MTTTNAPNPDDLIAQVVDAFERMPVPPAPSVREAIDLVQRAARAPEKETQDARRRLAFRFARLTAKQRFAAAGVGLSAIVGAVSLLVALNSGKQLSAMQRMARELREVKSYSYRESSHVTQVAEGGEPATTWDAEGSVWWLGPDAFHDEMKIVKIQAATPPGKQTEEVLGHFDQIFPADKPGIFIDHTNKTFFRCRFLPTNGSRTYPSDRLRMIREDAGQMKRDLGTKQIGGKLAHGYVMAFRHDARESRGFDALELWLDAETDLPLEFGYVVEDASKKTVWQATDFRWNTALNPALFDPTPPPGYADVTPPSDEKEFSQIADALKLYAQLSGGHYPRVTRFQANAIRDEMWKMAGFTGPPRDEWTQDKKFLEIRQAIVGLDWIEKILRLRHNSGYLGFTVAPGDKTKVLLWWRVDDVRVFYGDLRTQVLTESAWDALEAEQTSPDVPNGEPTPDEQ